jgi:tetratricopeptide (TPR) repeat protein
MGDTAHAERIRLRYLGHTHPPDGTQSALLNVIAADIAAECEVTRFRAHRLARAWTVAQAVEAFHRMCRRENIKSRGLTERSWMEWEAGSRPNWDYQDLLSRLFQASAIQLGWAIDYSLAGAAASRGSLAMSATVAAAGTATIEQASGRDGRRRSLLHLPPDISDFTGRAEQVTQVTRLIAAARESARSAPPIVCLSGPPGSGKTTLAIHVAHRIGRDFPDGQLYASLRGAGAGARDPADVLAGFLRELGIDGGDIPEGLDERARMYRAQLAWQRVLVVLDGASDEAQVRPLLPGSAGCAVLVTSRSRLPALAGSHAVTLGALPSDQAAALLAAVTGPDRAAAEPDAVTEIARLCGHLPLALRIAGARLASRPAWTVSWFAARLADESKRLDLLKAGDLEVRASFALSYDSRDAAEQRAFRMLGLLAADFPAWNLAALLDTDADEAERLLEQLADAALADIAGVDATGLIRYRLHDLLRDFARERLHQDEAPDSAGTRLARLADQYAGAAELAAALVHPGAHGSGTAPPRTLLAGDVVRGDPWGWLSAERDSLITLVGQAHAARLWDQAWRLAEALPVMFDWRADWRAWERTQRLALDAATQNADTTAKARTLRNLDCLYRELGRYDEAVTLLDQAAEIFGDLGDRHQWATAMRHLGDAYRYQGRLADAIGAFSDALAVFRVLGDARSVAGALNGTADACRGLARWEESAGAFRECIGVYRDLGDQLEEARATIRYALVFRDQQLSGQAIPLIAGGLEVVRRLGDRRWEARAMRQLAIVHRNDGETAEAITLLTQCLAILGELEDRRGEAVALRNRGDACRLAGRLDEAARDLARALEAFGEIGDRRWAARTRLSTAGLCRIRHDLAAAGQHLDAALDAFRAIGDRHAEARALREAGILHRDQGELADAWQALDASKEIFTQVGDALWTARVLASTAVLDGLSGHDPTPLASQAQAICREHGIAGDSIASALREW